MNSSDTSSAYTLSTLLPTTSFLLAYSLPLLLISSVLTFAGCFLTLDRSRSFAPRYEAIPGAFEQRPKKTKFTWMLEGGIGGLASGYVFGVHLSTCLALLIPSVTSSARLSRSSFLAIWILSCIPTTALAGRWKYCALVFSGISGGTLFSLGLSVIIHPALLTRSILLAILLPITLILVLLPLEKTRRHALRFATASTGAFGLTISTALLAHVPAWANVWERLWLKESIEWGTRSEKGLTAMFSLLLFIGVGVNWFLRRRFGECPDEKWDAYLANYSANYPSEAGRAGSFRPLTSFWDRLFHPSRQNSNMGGDIIFPTDKGATDSDIPLPRLHKHDSSDNEDDFDITKPTGGFLKKKKSAAMHAQARFKVQNIGARKTREVVKFRPDLSESDSGDEEILKSPSGAATQRPWLTQKPSNASSEATLIDATPRTPSAANKVGNAHGKRGSRADVNVGELDYDKELEKLKEAGKARGIRDGEAPEYSDVEEGDLGNAGQTGSKERGKNWSPGFLQRHRSGVAASSTSQGASSATSRTAAPPNALTTIMNVSPTSGNALAVPLGAVPATPSLIQALDRIAIAQQDAFRSPTPPQPTQAQPQTKAPLEAVSRPAPDGLPTSPQTQGRWQNFWREVEEKAQA
ncbi:hypothetical protein HGRIS_005856 [Hohenbuehelia grisea]|uniref:DUF4203 domain-containing protein n=1 Tax=Hohenbuehelia grisea TaxID=104357 RepID=A0ABR3JZJ8_9AGAR